MLNNREDKTYDALKWIVNVLKEKNIAYRIGGGLATHIYGGVRPVNDIDISISGSHFAALMPMVEEYHVVGPKHYKNEKWDCLTLSLNYQGQDIDLTDVDTLKMSSKDGKKWIQNKLLYKEYPDVTMTVKDLEVSLMHPRVLVKYKKELSGEHQEQDIEFLKNYILENQL